MLTKIFLYFGALLGIAFIILAIVQLKNEQQVDRICRGIFLATICFVTSTQRNLESN